MKPHWIGSAADIGGDFTVREFRKKIGAPTYRVWDALARSRGRDGTVLTTYRKIGVAALIHPDCVKDAMRKLTRLHLVEPVCYLPRRKYENDKCVNLRRRVYGVPAYVEGQEQALVQVPRNAYLAIKNMPNNHGGAREGAGRKPKNGACTVCDHARCKGACEACTTCRKRAEKESKNPHQNSDLGFQVTPTKVFKLPPSSYSLSLSSLSSASSPSEKKRAAEAAHDFVEASENEPKAATTPELVAIPDQTGLVEIESIGLMFAPEPKLEIPHDVALNAPHELVPIEVHAGLSAHTPEPPKLRKEDDLEFKCKMLVKWFEGAVHHRTGKDCWTFKSEKIGDITKSKHYATLVEACEMFEENAIQPAKWICFCVDAWISQKGKRANPPVKYVFSSMLRDSKIRHMYHDREMAYPNKQLMTTESRAFLVKQQAMRSDLRTLRSYHTDENIREIVEKHFKGGVAGFEAEYADARETVKYEVHKTQALIRQGVWTWRHW